MENFLENNQISIENNFIDQFLYKIQIFRILNLLGNFRRINHFCVRVLASMENNTNFMHMHLHRSSFLHNTRVYNNESKVERKSSRRDVSSFLAHREGTHRVSPLSLSLSLLSFSFSSYKNPTSVFSHTENNNSRTRVPENLPCSPRA